MFSTHMKNKFVDLPSLITQGQENSCAQSGGVDDENMTFIQERQRNLLPLLTFPLIMKL